jgi:hypothetical protein
MTDNQSETIVKFLEKIEKHLQAIDWKLWDMHQHFGKEKSNIDNEHIETPVVEDRVIEELESLAEIVSTPVASSEPEKPVVKHTLKYPSIEILK